MVPVIKAWQDEAESHAGFRWTAQQPVDGGRQRGAVRNADHHPPPPSGQREPRLAIRSESREWVVPRERLTEDCSPHSKRDRDCPCNKASQDSPS